MEQGNCLDSTPVSVAQEVGVPTDHESVLDAAITGLLQAPTRATASKSVPGIQPQSDLADLADACIEQVARLERWDANPGWLTEEQCDAEMDRWGAVFRRAIDQPSVDLRDLAGKAHLMLADLERFHPWEENSSDDARLMRVILAEAMRFGGLSGPATFISSDPILALIEEGRRLIRISDALHARPEVETAEAERAAEEERRDALRALYAHCDDAILKTVPLTAAGCRELARFGVEYFQSNGVPISDDEQAITRLIARCPLNAASGFSAQNEPKVTQADTDLLALVQGFDTAHSAWLAAARANDEPAERCNAHIKFAMARGVAAIPAHEQAWALPGVMAANDLEEATYSALAEIAMKALRMQAQSLAGLALQARAVTPLIWIDGEYAKNASLGEGEDLGKEAVRHLVESVLALSKAADINLSPSAGPEASSRLGRGDHALWQAIDAHIMADSAFDEAAGAADPASIRQKGGDTSADAMGPREILRLMADNAACGAWSSVIAARPRTLPDLLVWLRHVAEYQERYSMLHDSPDVFGALIGAVEGLRFAMLPRPADHDLSQLSIPELEHLARIAYRERETLMAIESQGFCWSENRTCFSALGRIIEAEGERMAFLCDRAVNEIERRRPTEKRDVNLRLEAMVRHHLNCNGYIEPELMTEVVQAWGRA